MNNTRYFGLLGIVCMFLISCNAEKKEAVTVVKTEIQTDVLLNQHATKLKEILSTLKTTDSFPRHIFKGKTNWELVGIKDWCSGFWAGTLWYAYEQSKDSTLLKGAKQFTEALESLAYTPPKNHDLGFQLYCSYGNGFRLTGNQKYKQILLDAANNLVTLYNPNVGSIHSWPYRTDYSHNTIIDNMMNLELLFWAAKNGGDASLYDMAESHAEVTMKHIVRPDATLYHVAAFNDSTGAFIKGYTHQGYADESMWARGQAWGIYGFSFTYKETGREDFLKTAINLSDKFLERLPEDGMPYWDFDDPKIPNTPKDASAAAVAACGLLELSTLVKDSELQVKYRTAAKKLINLLSSSAYLSRSTNQALLLHATGNYPDGSEIDESIIYADYYYMEALMRLKALETKV
ncbi:glycoside hydrolase family 88 protein [Formosa algae]|uniref:Unsaturated chondroitin disaccharide hydrolase n=1 Tax=Formosa algae TaxID=225843 RepID=A0A9X1C9K2_9FLAO|nr:glycoside hydrolase family 88 protein [Formosa algae]MBP1841276.1 unsaturated chondroitin disaccharide hydrolase [Formosa algae]MDQ0336801.1 unsaturated chondroitin disaccharide hydrolase [Formosa algae]OEI80573.1 glucuronyl hydrolase [Formosa algae]PNW28447.1 glucuronyl hydrolase [Formosa algae]